MHTYDTGLTDFRENGIFRPLSSQRPAQSIVTVGLLINLSIKRTIYTTVTTFLELDWKTVANGARSFRNSNLIILLNDNNATN